jgi:hypothetical protein
MALEKVLSPWSKRDQNVPLGSELKHPGVGESSPSLIYLAWNGQCQSGQPHTASAQSSSPKFPPLPTSHFWAALLWEHRCRQLLLRQEEVSPRDREGTSTPATGSCLSQEEACPRFLVCCEANNQNSLSDPQNAVTFLFFGILSV